MGTRSTGVTFIGAQASAGASGCAQPYHQHPTSTTTPGSAAMEVKIQTRREFCRQACKAAPLLAAGGALATFLQSCSSSDSPTGPGGQSLAVINATESGGKVNITVDSSSPLASTGSAAQVHYGGGILLVARTGQTTFTALTATCTHQACTINGYSNQIYTCPCHGSQFTTGGQVSRGPAASPLQAYATTFANNILTITL
jgi:cytochrome b6-f complex iron-sulfur subunit